MQVFVAPMLITKTLITLITPSGCSPLLESPACDLLYPHSLSLSAACLSHGVSGARALSPSVALPARDGAWGTEPAREWRLDRAEVVGESGTSLGDGDRELIEEREPCGWERGNNGGNEESSGGGELDRLGDEVLDESLGDAGGDGEGRLWTTSL